ncbi:MAG TPA: GspH/FimT family pseudopilin [Ramlibacter sp.]|nr:GspH/FimT family pseudopilin [Ramlibacter sp.]
MVASLPTRLSAARQRGVTLIELVVVISVLAVLASLAGPSMSRLIASQRVKTTASDLHLALMKARSEAIKRNVSITVEPSTGTNWSSGWSVKNGATVLDANAAPTAATITPSATTAAVVYRYDGRSTTAVQFVVSATSSTVSRCVSIDSTGRPYTKEGTSC